VLVFVVTLKVFGASVNVSFVSVVAVVLHFIFGHGISPHWFGVLLLAVFRFSYEEDTAVMDLRNVSRLTGWW
jgi:hypothetical protein